MDSRRKLIVGFLGIVLIAGAFLARPGYRALRVMRAQKLAAAAEAAIAKQAWPEASQKAQAGYQLAPNDPQVIRVVARLYTLAGHANAFTFWENLRKTGKATEEDRREFVRVGLQLGKGMEVVGEVVALANSQPASAANLQLAAEFFSVSGDRTNALRASKALAALQKGERSDLVVARALLAMRGKEEVEEARQILERLSGLSSSAGLEALVVLGKGGLVGNEKLRGLIDQILKHPDARVPHRLLAEELKLRLRPEDRGKAVESFAREFAGSALTNRVEVARWLNRQKEFARTVEMLPAKDVVENKEAFLARLDALAALGKWIEVQAELAIEKTPIEAVLKELFLARAARELKKLPEADAHWRRVQLELASQPEALLYVAEYAEKIGEKEEARKSYEKLAAFPEFADRAFTGLIRLAEATGGTRTLREIMRDLTARWPDDPAPANDFAYLNLLLEERIPASQEAAQKLYDAHPNVLAYRVTLALAHLRKGETARAREVLDVKVDWNQVRPGWQAVHAAVRAANGETELAQALARQIPHTKLKPEERALIQKLI